jgi:RHS repeat-associated protein
LTSEINNGIESYYAYNKLSQVTAHENQHNGDRLYREEFEYNSDGNQKSKTEIGINDEVAKVTNYMYDNANRLKSETTACHSGLEPESTETFGMYEYDEYGNRKQQYTLDFIMDVSTVTYNYNLLGQFTGGEIEKEGETTTFSYEYNPAGQRSSKTVNGETTKYIWDGQNIVGEMDETGAVAAKYIRGNGLITRKTGSTKQFYNRNAHGDVTSLSNPNGSVINRYDYDAWGNLNVANSFENVPQPFQYSGEYWDSETDLYYLRNRYYDAKSGRFTQEDPIRSGQNWYVYCGNNPVNFVDPWGLSKYAIIVGSPGESQYNAGSLFINAADAYIDDKVTHDDEVWILYCGKQYKSENGGNYNLRKSSDGYVYVADNVENLGNMIGNLGGGDKKIDRLVFFGHSGGDFYAFNEPGENLNGSNNPNIGERWDANWFSADAQVAVHGCESRFFAFRLSCSINAKIWAWDSDLGFVSSGYKYFDALYDRTRNWTSEDKVGANTGNGKFICVLTQQSH